MSKNHKKNHKKNDVSSSEFKIDEIERQTNIKVEGNVYKEFCNKYIEKEFDKLEIHDLEVIHDAGNGL